MENTPLSNLIHTDELSTEEDVPEARVESAPEQTLRVLIADDHDLVREALSQRIEREPDLSVTALAKDGSEIGELVRNQPFDVVLLDIEMPGPSVFEVVEEVIRTRPITERLQGGSSLIGGLTPREVEVMAHVTRGHTKRETAELLSISVKTVESHVQNLMKKLAVHNNVELTRFAIREGFVRP